MRFRRERARTCRATARRRDGKFDEHNIASSAATLQRFRPPIGIGAGLGMDGDLGVKAKSASRDQIDLPAAACTEARARKRCVAIAPPFRRRRAPVPPRRNCSMQHREEADPMLQALLGPGVSLGLSPNGLRPTTTELSRPLASAISISSPKGHTGGGKLRQPIGKPARSVKLGDQRLEASCLQICKTGSRRDRSVVAPDMALDTDAVDRYIARLAVDQLVRRLAV